MITTRNPAQLLGGRRQINKTKKYADWCAQQIVSEMEFNRISGLNGTTVAGLPQLDQTTIPINKRATLKILFSMLPATASWIIGIGKGVIL